MSRRTVNLLTLLSLLLCLGIAAMWVRGVWVSDHWQWADRREAWRRRTVVALETGRGLLSVRVMTGIDPAWADPRGGLAYYARRPPDHLDRSGMSADVYVNLVVARYWGTDRSGFAYDRFFIVPLWALVAVTGLLPGARLAAHLVRQHTRRRSVRTGLCPACGYDLRASPEQCPECGATARTPPGRL